jgi:hypothetical protein
MNLPVQAAPVARGHVRVQQLTSLTQQGCNWFKCAGVAVTCVTACLSGVGTPGCIACLGSAYDSCKDCF